MKRRRQLPRLQPGKSLSELPALPRIIASIAHLSRVRYSNYDAVLQIVAVNRRRLPYTTEFRARRVRLGLRSNKVVAINLPQGTTAVQLSLDPHDTFTCHEILREALDAAQLKPGAKIAIDFRCKRGLRKFSKETAYAAMAHVAQMPNFENKTKQAKPVQISLHGFSSRSNVIEGASTAAANILCRQLCILPGNKLTAASLIEKTAEAAKAHGLEHEHIDLKKLRKINANLFLAVTGAQSHGGLVRLSYRCGRKKAKRVSILGKGVCFDTGGLNIKPHRDMLGMQGDMAGAAAALGAIIACKHQGLHVDVDAWLAVAENLVEATSMRPGDIITAHSGKSVEIIHTDAEGRMLLADSLSILTKDKPDMVITLATLTGSMITAAGTHMSGVTGDPSLVKQACAVGKTCGERLLPFPLPEDYMMYLKSKVADIMQCSAGDEPDHILAGLFLNEFTNGIPWLHLDLSASSCKGGLGAIPTEQTGFGAAWLVNWLEHVAKQH